jgi:TolB-like protein/AraC-like DNA-binding protein/Tfp pilus assembly protein PilF
MDKSFIDKLHEIVINHLADENFGAGNLASLLGLSTSQTLRKVKAATGRSVIQYIKEVKLAKAAKLIMETDFTSAEIAYKVGFSSPSYFNKTFHKRYGITPGGYKAQESIQKEKDSIKVRKSTPFHKKLTKQSLIIISSTIVLLFATMAYYFYQNSKNNINSNTFEKIINDKSIAILPFKNLSKNKENQYFADGIMDVILNHLTNIKDLKVISRTSMEQYRETTKTIPDIAKELGVSYILEASVQKDNDEIRIITQLIDAKNDKHIWSTDIKKEYKDIFELQSTIAEQISKELNIELSDAERNQIEKKPTNNLEAYNLYLKGVHLLRNGSANKSLKYFEQAIEKDPEFAIAYLELAAAHMTLIHSGTISPDKNTKKIKELAQKVIALDPSLGNPHAILAAMLFRYDWNWNAAEKEFLKALKLNSKHFGTYLLYAKFLRSTNRIEESREQINKALLLNPVYSETYIASAFYYYYSGDYKKALSENKKGLDLRIKFEETNWLKFQIYIAQKNNDKAIIELQKYYKNESDEIDKIYKQYGINGIYNWLIKIDSVKENYNTPYQLAQKYAFIGENKKALSLLEKSAALRITAMSDINLDPNFKNLRADPRFKEIIKEMGLDAYLNQ